MPNPLITTARDQLTTAETEYSEVRSNFEQRLAALPDSATPADVDRLESEFRGLLATAESAVEQSRKRVANVERIDEARDNTRHLIPTGDRISVTREFDTYNPYNPEGPSFFADLYSVTKTGSPVAAERLRRNNAEVAQSRGARESRAVLTTSDFYAPVWAANEYVTTMRPRLVYAALVQQLPLPSFGETVTIPAYAGPTDSANYQQGDNASIQDSAGTTSQITAPIALAAGELTLPRQAVERATPGLDLVVIGDISRDIAYKIERACLNGTGSNQPKGVLQESAVPAVTVSAQTAAQFLLKLADLMQRVETATGEPCDFVVMHPRRFSWLASLLDGNGRPLISPTGQGAYQAFGLLYQQDAEDGLSLEPDVRPMGSMAGLNIYSSSSIPSTNGPSTSEDPVLVGVRSLAVKWNDPAGIRTFQWDAVASDTASIRLQALTYSSYVTRYPAAFGVIKGLTAPTF